MILPRQPVPYENLSELVQDKFTIYSRGKFERREPNLNQRRIMIYRRPLSEDITYDKTRNYITDGPQSGRNFKIASEIRSVLNNVVDFLGQNRSVKEKKLYQQLETNTTLIAGLDSIVRDAYEQLWPRNKSAILGYDWKLFNIDAENFVNRQQQGILNALIEQCNNTALILPRVEANRLARKVQNKHLGLVHIGKENYYAWDYLIYFIGHVPPFVVDGIRTMQWTGIANKLVEFAASSYKPAPYSPTLPTRATMSGNVAVIFAILAVGLVIALLAFSVELHTFTLKFLCRIESEIRITWMWFLSCINLFTYVRRTNVNPFVGEP
ncbi:unnamed protein product [Orchesella dallaii]|uniref:Uncharacterized protein n=1 Tax=Orchesella dallaii TaxID=48710 RepID=A0ABP1Q101_9HEXA